jgi:hypothetical protein
MPGTTPTEIENLLYSKDHTRTRWQLPTLMATMWCYRILFHSSATRCSMCRKWGVNRKPYVTALALSSTQEATIPRRLPGQSMYVSTSHNDKGPWTKSPMHMDIPSTSYLYFPPPDRRACTEHHLWAHDATIALRSNSFQVGQATQRNDICWEPLSSINPWHLIAMIVLGTWHCTPKRSSTCPTYSY